MRQGHADDVCPRPSGDRLLRRVLFEGGVLIGLWPVARSYGLPATGLANQLYDAAMQRICKQCRTVFDLTDADRTLYARHGVPEPDICHPCSERLRFSFRNERHFYRRKSELSGKDIICLYAPEP